MMRLIFTRSQIFIRKYCVRTTNNAIIRANRTAYVFTSDVNSDGIMKKAKAKGGNSNVKSTYGSIPSLTHSAFL